MANHFISTHFPAEKQKLIDLTAKRTSLLSHHTKTVADSLEDGDYKNAIYARSTHLEVNNETCKYLV